ncbi:MAG: cell division protein FtsL [Marinobacter sp.]|nr:cell division protein FtsL [Marinobacter sp.]
MSAVTLERPPKKATLNRQVVREGLSSTLGLSRQIFQALCQRNVAISFALVLTLIGSAIGVVVSGHQNRVLFNQLAQLHAQRDHFEREWSQLLLEQSALSAQSRIERRASDKLGMVVPEKDQIVLVSAP